MAPHSHQIDGGMVTLIPLDESMLILSNIDPNIRGLEYCSQTGLLYGDLSEGSYWWHPRVRMVSINPSTGIMASLGVLPTVKYGTGVSSGGSTMVGPDYYSIMLDQNQNQYLVHMSVGTQPQG